MIRSKRRRALLNSVLASAGLTLLLFVGFGPGLAWIRPDSEPPKPAQARQRPAWIAAEELGSTPAATTTLELASVDPAAASPLDTASIELVAPPEPEDPGAASLDCLIEPSEIADLGSSVTGILEWVPVERSDFVYEGQIVAELESNVEAQAAGVAEARARMDGEIRSRTASLELGSRRKERARQLFEKRALSDELRDEIETEARVAQLELEQAREERRLASLQLSQALALLERRTIRSPFSGVVVDRLMSPGERVDDEPILRIARIDPLSVEVVLPGALFGTIRPGSKAAIVPEFHDDQVHVASVTVVDRVIDAASGTFGVRLELPNPDQAIPSGLHCQVRFLDE